MNDAFTLSSAGCINFLLMYMQHATQDTRFVIAAFTVFVYKIFGYFWHFLPQSYLY